MGAKKKDASKKKSKKAGANDPADGIGLTPEEKIKHLQFQAEALEMQLAHRSEMAADATAECESMRIRMLEAKVRYEEEKQTALDVTRNMTRQYKGMQEELLNKINEREGTIQKLRDEIDRMKKTQTKSEQEKNGVIKGKDVLIAKLEAKMDDICVHFSNMISEALGRITGQIEAHSVTCDDLIVTKRMEEFKLG